MKNLLIILFALLLLSACKKENRKSIIQVKSKISDTDNNYKEHEIIKFKFPDTVSLNTMVEGKIEYDRNFGKTVDSKIKERYLFFHVGTDQDSQNLALEKFDRFPYRLAFEDTIGNGLIPFETSFTKSGLNYLHGVVKDIYIIETSKIDDSINVSNKETLITKRVFVVDKKNEFSYSNMFKYKKYLAQHRLSANSGQLDEKYYFRDQVKNNKADKKPSLIHATCRNQDRWQKVLETLVKEEN